MKNGFVAAAMIATLASSGVMAAGQQPEQTAGQTVQVSGTAKDEAKKPYMESSVRARDIMQGQIAGTSPLDIEGAWTMAALPPGKYAIELLNRDGKVVCTEGPFDLTKDTLKDGVVIDCNKIPAVWWIVGAGAAAGVTAGVVTTGAASPSR